MMGSLERFLRQSLSRECRDEKMVGSLERFLRQPITRECQVQSHFLSSAPSAPSTVCSGADGSWPISLRQPISSESQLLGDVLSLPPSPKSISCSEADGSLPMSLRQATSGDSQSRSDFLSVSPYPQSSLCSGADESDESMDQEDNRESVFEGDIQDLFLYLSGPAKRLPESRLVGRHFMTKSELRRRCALCTKTEPRRSAAYQSKISLFCKQCNVFLHFECFEEYHTMAAPVSKWAGGA
jgi:hypothetical protein